MSPDTAKTECSAYLIWDTSTREQHIARVAWLVNNYRDDFPVDIDFGVPSHGCHFSVEDGHHRIAAAIFLQKKYIMVNAS